MLSRNVMRGFRKWKWKTAKDSSIPSPAEACGVPVLLFRYVSCSSRWKYGSGSRSW